MNRTQSTVALLATLAFAASAQASFLKNGSGLANPDQTITFESVALTDNVDVTTQFAGYGVTFSTAFGNDDHNAYANISGNRIGNFRSGTGQMGLFTMDFASQLSDVAFAMVTQPGTTTFRALLDGVLVESQTQQTSTSDPDDFFGFQGIDFNQLTIEVTGSIDNALVLDNLQTVALQTAPVPEPETWALMMAGTFVVVTIARRRRQALRR